MNPEFNVHRDAWSSGQVSSKIWLCQQLERLAESEQLPAQVIWILGGWHGVLSFLLLSRERFPIAHIRSFDADPRQERTADLLNENWVWNGWRFKAQTADANQLDYHSADLWTSRQPDLVINTSSEHFDSREWFERIPLGTLVAIQSNDMAIEEHVNCVRSVEELRAKFEMSQVYYSGDLRFEYPDLAFTRFMLIGRR